MTFVTTWLRDLSPRSSLTTGAVWLVIALAASFATAASLLAGRVAREIVVQQHVRRLALETDQLGSDLGQAIAARIGAVRALDARHPSSALFQQLEEDFPELGWIAVADLDGTVLASDGSMGSTVSAAPWFLPGLRGPWIGRIDPKPGSLQSSSAAPLLGDLALPIHAADGRTTGVVAAHLTWRWADRDIERLSDTLDARGSAQTLILDQHEMVLVGPQALRNQAWNGVPLSAPKAFEVRAASGPDAPRFEHLPDGNVVLVARAPVSMLGVPEAQRWRVQLSEPKAHVFERADALAVRILWISICLAGITALLGALGARRLTERLRLLTASAVAIGGHRNARIEVPPGNDEVAKLGAAFATVLDDLRQERRAEESRYAAVVRERLKIARDLHDTLAHSMMAMLSEVRLLRKLQAHDPGALAEELQNAEAVAHAGLIEARTAITHMRVNAVRDTGLGAALNHSFERFLDRTGLSGEFTQDARAADFGDERAETLFRMAEEALRNIERHARASRVHMRLAMSEAAMLELSIEDDGVGFDPQIAHPGHFGLVGLREQAHVIGADLSIRSSAAGTRLCVALRTTPEHESLGG